MKETINNLKRVYQYGKKYKFNLVLEVIGSILGIIISIVVPILSAQQLVGFTDSIWTQVIFISIILFFVNILQSLSTVMIRKNTQVFWAGTVKNIKLDLGKELLKIEQECIDNSSSGTFIQRLTHDTENLASIFTIGIGYLTGLTSSIGVFVAVFFINRQIFLYYLIISFILTLLYLSKVKKYGIKFSDFLNQSDNVTSLTSELVRGIRDIKMLNARDNFMNKLHDNIEIQNKKRVIMRNIEIMYNFIIDFLKGLFELFLILILIYLVKKEIISIAIAVVLFSYRTNVMGDFMEKLGNLLNEIKNFNISCNRVFSLLRDQEFRKERFGNKHINAIKGNFEFDNVTFGYIENIPILKELSFKINENEMVAFVGKSGVGKTTIFSLLCKMYSIQNGKIKIDDEDINDLDEYSIRENITIISQNPYFFNMSIRDNLNLVEKDLTEEEMIEACRMACLDEFIDTLPEKYDTIIGEGGVTLSGGQRQRLAIARAFIQDTKIILFDEATSALDNETQEHIQQAISNMKDKYTILIIAHRLSTIVNSDKIMLVENGHITDSGTHKELLLKNKTYKKLYENDILDK